MNHLADHAHGHGNELVAALNPDTPLERIEPYRQSLDAVQFMTVQPGLQGQQFLSDVLPKVRRFHAQYPEMPIMVDGGITPTTAMVCAHAGASLAVSGSYILNASNTIAAIGEFASVVY
jgi:ribulose-phosphate 3-epimerase